MLSRVALALCALVWGATASSPVLRSLPPFSQVKLPGCMPFSVRIAEGDYGVSLSGFSSSQQAAVSTEVHGSTLVLQVTKSMTASGVSILVTLPAGLLSSLVHNAGGGVYVTATPAPSFFLGANNGWVHVAPDSVTNNANDVTVLLTGQQPVAVCAAGDTSLNSLTATLSGQGDLFVNRYSANSLQATNSGQGQLVVDGQASFSASVSFTGSGSVQVAAQQANVQVSGMGDVYVSRADYISGSTSGMGKVYYSPSGCNCQVQGGFFGGCAYGEPPGSRLGCGRSSSDVDRDNARGWVVEVNGNSCSAHTPNAARRFVSVVFGI